MPCATLEPVLSAVGIQIDLVQGVDNSQELGLEHIRIVARAVDVGERAQELRTFTRLEKNWNHLDVAFNALGDGILHFLAGPLSIGVVWRQNDDDRVCLPEAVGDLAWQGITCDDVPSVVPW